MTRREFAALHYSYALFREKKCITSKAENFLVRFIQGTPPQKMLSLLVKILIERFLRRKEAKTLTNFEIEALVSFFWGIKIKIGLIPLAQMLSVTGSILLTCLLRGLG